MSEEQWRPVAGFPDYEVSSLGRVMSHKKATPRELRNCGIEGRYKLVHLSRDGRPYTRRVHRLVAEAFLGPLPPGCQTRHLDGDQYNNAATNLAYGSVSDNVYDAVAHGTHHNASKDRCKWGHEFTPENTMTKDGKWRECRICHRANSRASYNRRMLASANVRGSAA